MVAMLRPSVLAAIIVTVVGCGTDATVDPKVGECADYCDLISEHCLGALAQYSDRNSCLSTCQAMPLGDATTHAGHTIMCRTFTAATAELDASSTCTKAGPGGDDGCGANCESFCAMAGEICTGANQTFASTAECMTACAAYDASIEFDASQTSGDTFACRLYHLTAASNDPATHCPHIGPVSVTCRS